MNLNRLLHRQPNLDFKRPKRFDPQMSDDDRIIGVAAHNFTIGVTPVQPLYRSFIFLVKPNKQ